MWLINVVLRINITTTVVNGTYTHILKNGTGVYLGKQNAAEGNRAAHTTAFVPMSTNDYVEVFFRQNEGIAFLIHGSTSGLESRLEIVQL